MKVQLTYFKSGGKYYSDGEYETEKEQLWEIWDEIREMLKKGKKPGLIDGPNEFHVLVNVAGHKHEHPCLIICDE